MAERHVVDPDGDCIFHIQQLPQSIKDKGHQNFHSKIIEPEKNDTETLAEISKISTEIQEVEFQHLRPSKPYSYQPMDQKETGNKKRKTRFIYHFLTTIRIYF
ncbi:hypothetical protein BPOR_1260g00040 [Botrytis porri]|uniref:Uncharacterized protein n=1 Tax=Botrytis porri TaxID=87229 RepID=A0A4Z1K516_9HELO|nr:hypothetical protein BPOR_1260g00040 [Botrytis porri]